MARFAYECILQTKQLTKELDASLGPGTSDLALRIGLHSGSVIAGVLRGDKSRFQLFGDTMNTASRMESNGERNRIQVSQETADLIVAGGKGHWLTARADLIKAKGKGDLQTYWLTPQRRSKAIQRELGRENASVKNAASGPKILADMKARKTQALTSQWIDTSTDSLDALDEAFNSAYSKDQRLVDWNTDILCSLLSKLVSSRDTRSRKHGGGGDSSSWSVNTSRNSVAGYLSISSVGERKHHRSGTTNPLGIVRDELREYVGRIAALYRDNTFHNFEHASHVALSANKLLKRIITPTTTDDGSLSQSLSQSTYGISSDPLLQFVIVLSALVHDCDHAGVPNSQLVKEKAPLAAKYNNKSVAERHSVSLALKVLSEPQFQNLQACIYPTVSHYQRFRDLLINAVLATDINDKELKLNRQMRWTAAFHGPLGYHDPKSKATIVVDHIIQASDVAHTMQHWHIFRKWNAKLYNEMYDAYIDGRADTDPGLNWYESELGFFDFYIIPLAKKLKECGVFGISSDEYLNYALENRLEWEHRGREVTAEMIALRQAHEECSTRNVEADPTLQEDWQRAKADFDQHQHRIRAAAA
jgi:3'5'-cyclic nucleotide phosphodiesterase/Adenylate and Guanylate cyclase catalytic domain